MKQLAFFSFLIYFFPSNKAIASSFNQEVKVHDTVIFVAYLNNGLKADGILVIEQDVNQNMIIKIVNSDSVYLFDASGCGNCSPAYTSNKNGYFAKHMLDKSSKYPQYTLSAIVNGSTYGAEYLFIIWFANNQWHIIRTNFDRYEIRDTNKDGYEEIIDYSNHSKGIPYYFNKGLMIRGLRPS